MVELVDHPGDRHFSSLELAWTDILGYGLQARMK